MKDTIHHEMGEIEGLEACCWVYRRGKKTQQLDMLQYD